MRRRGRRSRADDPQLLAFLEHVQSNVGGFYEHMPTKKPVEFIRPLGNLNMRVKDMKTGAKFNTPFYALRALNEMEVLALQLMDDEEQPE